MDFSLLLFKIFAVILALCAIPLLIVFGGLAVIFFAVHFAVIGISDIIGHKIPTYNYDE